jgi:hypothetical protein
MSVLANGAGNKEPTRSAVPNTQSSLRWLKQSPAMFTTEVVVIAPADGSTLSTTAYGHGVVGMEQSSPVHPS